MSERKREILPWFPFNVAEYLADTMRLTTEAHGAYLLLILDYYATGEPCPDDDFVLAAVAKLHPDAWARYRKVIEPYFEVREGRWFHNRIEREMRDACDRHSKRIAAATTAAASRWERPATKLPKKARQAKQTTAEAPKDANRIASGMRDGMPDACVTVSVENAHSTLTIDSLSTAAPAEKGLQEREEGIGTTIPPNYRPTAAVIEECLKEATASDFELELQKFIFRQRESGGFSNDWGASFGMWWARFKDHRAKTAKPVKPAPPRVEVNNTASMESAINAALSRFKTGSQWSRGLGPEPGQPGCRIPPDVIRRHGIDPVTGLALRTETAK